MADSVRKIVSELTLMTSGVDALQPVTPPPHKAHKKEDSIVRDNESKQSKQARLDAMKDYHEEAQQR